MAGLAGWIILGIGLGSALFIYRAMHAGGEYIAYLLMGKIFKLSLPVKVALLQAVNLFSLFMGNLLNIGMAAAAVEKAVGAVLVYGLGDIQQAKHIIFINMAHAAVLVADKTVVDINSPCSGRREHHGKNKRVDCCPAQAFIRGCQTAVFFHHRTALPQ